MRIQTIPLLVVFPLLSLAACQGSGTTDPEPDVSPEPEPSVEPEPEAEPEPQGIAALGAGSHALENVDVVTIVDVSHGLNRPRDLAFHPRRANEMWIVNRADDSTVTVMDTGLPTQSTLKLIDPFALHFMEEVSSISFDNNMQFATCQESRNTYNGMAAPNDFMGPSLWTSDLDIYAQTNPDAVAFLGYDLGSHLDMLHQSPNCMGIAWEQANIYWTFEGQSGTIARQDFREDHGPGFDDHSDGVIERFVEASVSRMPNVPSHLVFDHASGLLYIADTGGARITVLDPSGSSVDASLPVIEAGTKLYRMTGASYETLIEPENGGLDMPSGLAMHDDVLYVSDNATSRILAYTMTGDLIDWLETGLPAGSLMGIRLDAQGRIYAVDNLGNKVLRYSAKSAN